jgi:hypothetical protein
LGVIFKNSGPGNVIYSQFWLYESVSEKSEKSTLEQETGFWANLAFIKILRFSSWFPGVECSENLKTSSFFFQCCRVEEHPILGAFKVIGSSLFTFVCQEKGQTVAENVRNQSCRIRKLYGKSGKIQDVC